MQKISKNYTSLAPYYDLLMRRIRYRDWMRYVESIIHMHTPNAQSVLDIACGTGNGMLNLRKKYRLYVAFDRSFEMIRIFKSKLGFYDIKPLLFVADVRNIPLKSDVIDAAFSIFDSLNNLLTPRDLKKAFTEVFRVLKKGGVFIFDMNTPYVLKEHWGTKTRIEEDEDILSIWRTRYQNGISELHITLFVKEVNNKYVRIDEIHRERGYETQQVLSLLKDAGFSEVYAYDHMTFSPPPPDSLRVNYVAIK